MDLAFKKNKTINGLAHAYKYLDIDKILFNIKVYFQVIKYISIAVGW